MSDRTQRRLAAIVSADVVGYSRLMGADEAGTLSAMRAHRKELWYPTIKRFGGRVVGTAGDAILVEYASAVAAVESSIAVQHGMTERNADLPDDKRMLLRIGINIGEVIIEDDDIYGDGVNVAARLQEIAVPGGLAVSGNIHEQIEGKLDGTFTDNGLHELKNIARPVPVWCWSAIAGQVPAARRASDQPLALPDKPSIAVLPFDNMSGDAEQDYFVDGVVEDILTTLSKVQNLFVIARNSSFTYKGRAMDVRQVGQELGVKYVVEGSVRKAGNRVRVTAQLVECANGGHLWADRFDGELDDVFDLQDRITQEIVTALEVTLTEGEHARIWRERSGSPAVYEAFQKAMSLYRNFSRQSHRQAIHELERALEINPDYPPAMFLYGFALVDLARFGWTDDREAAFVSALEMAENAIALDPYYADAYSTIGYARTFQRRPDEAVEAAEKAISLSPNNSGAFHSAAMAHVFAGNFEIARGYEEQAGRLSPMDQSVSLVDLARANYHLGAYEEARRISATVLERQPRWMTAQTILVAALWRLGREAEARVIADKVIQGHSKFSVARWSSGFPYRRAEDLAALMDPLLATGLPE